MDEQKLIATILTYGLTQKRSKPKDTIDTIQQFESYRKREDTDDISAAILAIIPGNENQVVPFYENIFRYLTLDQQIKKIKWKFPDKDNKNEMLEYAKAHSELSMLYFQLAEIHSSLINQGGQEHYVRALENAITAERFGQGSYKLNLAQISIDAAPHLIGKKAFKFNRDGFNALRHVRHGDAIDLGELAYEIADKTSKEIIEKYKNSTDQGHLKELTQANSIQDKIKERQQPKYRKRVLGII